jgi:hypothetical protein
VVCVPDNHINFKSNTSEATESSIQLLWPAAPHQVQGLGVEKVWPCYAGGSGAQLCEGHIMSTSGAPSVIHGRPVFVLDCNADLHFGRPSKECDAVIDQVVDFLLHPA